MTDSYTSKKIKSTDYQNFDIDKYIGAYKKA